MVHYLINITHRIILFIPRINTLLSKLLLINIKIVKKTQCLLYNLLVSKEPISDFTSKNDGVAWDVYINLYNDKM